MGGRAGDWFHLGFGGFFFLKVGREVFLDAQSVELIQLKEKNKLFSTVCL